MPFSPEALRHRRLAVGLSQDQLSALLGCTPGQISNYETGRFRPSIDRLEPLAEALGVRIDALFEQNGASNGHR